MNSITKNNLWPTIYSTVTFIKHIFLEPSYLTKEIIFLKSVQRFYAGGCQDPLVPEATTGEPHPPNLIIFSSNIILVLVKRYIFSSSNIILVLYVSNIIVVLIRETCLKINSQSLEDTQVGYISQKYSFDKYTLGRAFMPSYTFLSI